MRLRENDGKRKRNTKRREKRKIDERKEIQQ